MDQLEQLKVLLVLSMFGNFVLVQLAIVLFYACKKWVRKSEYYTLLASLYRRAGTELEPHVLAAKSHLDAKYRDIQK